MQVFVFPAQDLVGDLKEKLSNHFKDVMVGLMYPPPSYDAHELWHAMKVERVTLLYCHVWSGRKGGMS